MSGGSITRQIVYPRSITLIQLDILPTSMPGTASGISLWDTWLSQLCSCPAARSAQFAPGQHHESPQHTFDDETTPVYLQKWIQNVDSHIHWCYIVNGWGFVLYQSLRHTVEVVYAHNVPGWPTMEPAKTRNLWCQFSVHISWADQKDREGHIPWNTG